MEKVWRHIKSMNQPNKNSTPLLSPSCLREFLKHSNLDRTTGTRRTKGRTSFFSTLKSYHVDGTILECHRNKDEWFMIFVGYTGNWLFTYWHVIWIRHLIMNRCFSSLCVLCHETTRLRNTMYFLGSEFLLWESILKHIYVLRWINCKTFSVFDTPGFNLDTKGPRNPPPFPTDVSSCFPNPLTVFMSHRTNTTNVFPRVNSFECWHVIFPTY